MTIRIVLADEQKLMRHVLHKLLDLEPDMEVIGEADTRAQLLSLTLRLNPDIVLMDIALSGKPDIKVVTDILQQRSNARILILTAVENQEVALQALQAGAAGYLLKTIDLPELIKALYSVLQGGMPLAPRIARFVLGQIYHTPPKPKHLSQLTTRECEVLDLLGQGCSNAEIAEKLVITAFTARSHVSSVLKKLNLSSRTKAALYLLNEQQKQHELRLS
ncbi:MAG TPA: response regulator transcription factor [Caldilineaceae bacterium]|nr:response regulator transcription factor [Caldilineaceae bacterium]